MSFFKSLPEDAGPANVFGTYTDIYGPWSQMGQAIMNGPSPFTPGERELIAAFVVGTANCKFAYTAHSAAAYAWGIEEGLVDKLLENIDSAPVDDKFKPLFKFIRKLTLTPSEMAQEDADAVFKCCPPIREQSNAEALWRGLKEGLIDFIVSDHSPTLPVLKRHAEGDFQS